MKFRLRELLKMESATDVSAKHPAFTDFFYFKKRSRFGWFIHRNLPSTTNPYLSSEVKIS